jgi:hypothetical protein
VLGEGLSLLGILLLKKGSFCNILHGRCRLLGKIRIARAGLAVRVRSSFWEQRCSIEQIMTLMDSISPKSKKEIMTTYEILINKGERQGQGIVKGEN